MELKPLKIKDDFLLDNKKHKLLIVQDYEKRQVFFIYSILLFIGGIAVSSILSAKHLYELASFFIAIFWIIAGFLVFISNRCPLCDKFKSHKHIGSGFFKSKTNACVNCDLTDAQISRYIDMLKRGVEINEDNVRRIFIEK